MALAASLLPGFQYEVTGGMYEGEIVTIVDNTPFPDGDPEGRQRKITAMNDMGDEFYILPRLLGNSPVGVATANPTPVALAQSAVVSLPNPIVATTPAEITSVLTGTPVYEQVIPISDPMDPRLDKFRPSKAKLKRYVPRTMSNGMTDIEFLLTFTNADYRNENDGYPANTMLKGDTQAGKTMLVEKLAVEWSELLAEAQRQRGETVTYTKPMPVFTLSGSSGITDYDLFGQTTSYTDPETGRESLVWLPGIADLAAQCGGILYLDECNSMAERVTSSLHPLCDHRHHFVNRNKAVKRGGVFMPEIVRAHPDLWIIGTYNEGYRGNSDMNEAFINRFRHISWGYDATVEGKLVTSAALRLLGECLRASRAKNTLRTPIGTAALERVERDVETFGPVLGLEVLTGMFKANERDIVEEIIKARSIIVMLNEELRQKQIEDANRGV